MRRAVLVAMLAVFLGACAGAQAQEVSMTAVDLAFQPARLEVTAGRLVRLTMRNEGTLEHDFSILEMPMETMGATAVPMEGHEMTAMGSEAQLHMAVAMGTSSSLEFTPTKPGTYEFFCSVPGHKEAGMVGTLVVLAP